MIPSVTALVIGVGEFGKHYAHILSQLNDRGLPHVPKIDKLIVTRTRLNPAEEFAESLRQSEACNVNKVIAAEVRNTDHLHQLLERYPPHFTAITAKDKDLGDTVHALYAVDALKYGAVLCEKPFCNANGDGSSLQYFHELERCKNSALFGLELPLAVVTREMVQIKDLRSRLLQANRLDFYWGARVRGDNRVIDDLALHPWSLIPPQFNTKLVDVQNRGNQADIHINMVNPKNTQTAACRIILRAGDNLRGMMIDDYAITIVSDGRLIKLVQVDASLKDAVLQANESLKGDVLLQVNNPLEQHIVAALCRQPIVGLSRTYQSQLFLEKLHGYVS